MYAVFDAQLRSRKLLRSLASANTASKARLVSSSSESMSHGRVDRQVTYSSIDNDGDDDKQQHVGCNKQARRRANARAPW